MLKLRQGDASRDAKVMVVELRSMIGTLLMRLVSMAHLLVALDITPHTLP